MGSRSVPVLAQTKEVVQLARSPHAAHHTQPSPGWLPPWANKPSRQAGPGTHKAKKLVSADSLRNVSSRRRLGCTMVGNEAGTWQGCCGRAAGGGAEGAKRVGGGSARRTAAMLPRGLSPVAVAPEGTTHLRWRRPTRGTDAAIPQLPVAITRLRPAGGVAARGTGRGFAGRGREGQQPNDCMPGCSQM